MFRPTKSTSTYTRSTVIPWCALLEKSVPVHGGSLVEVVCDFDLDPVTLRLLDTELYISYEFSLPNWLRSAVLGTGH